MRVIVSVLHDSCYKPGPFCFTRLSIGPCAHALLITPTLPHPPSSDCAGTYRRRWRDLDEEPLLCQRRRDVAAGSS